jgi:hypothetical protein
VENAGADVVFTPQFVVGGLVFAACVAVHVAVTHFMIRRILPWISRIGPDDHMVIAMVAVAGSLGVAHVLEIILWASVMDFVDGVREGDALYFAFTSYTTLGYGDVVGEPGWRLLGPMSAMTGILLFGWSTAIIVQVLSNVLPNRRI